MIRDKGRAPGAQTSSRRWSRRKAWQRLKPAPTGRRGRGCHDWALGRDGQRAALAAGPPVPCSPARKATLRLAITAAGHRRPVTARRAPPRVNGARGGWGSGGLPSPRAKKRGPAWTTTRSAKVPRACVPARPPLSMARASPPSSPSPRHASAARPQSTTAVSREFPLLPAENAGQPGPLFKRGPGRLVDNLFAPPQDLRPRRSFHNRRNRGRDLIPLTVSQRHERPVQTCTPAHTRPEAFHQHWSRLETAAAKPAARKSHIRPRHAQRSREAVVVLVRGRTPRAIAAAAGCVPVKWLRPIGARQRPRGPGPAQRE